MFQDFIESVTSSSSSSPPPSSSQVTTTDSQRQRVESSQRRRSVSSGPEGGGFGSYGCGIPSSAESSPSFPSSTTSGDEENHKFGCNAQSGTRRRKKKSPAYQVRIKILSLICFFLKLKISNFSNQR